MRRLSGRGRSALIIGLQGIRARKARTLLSMISLFLGVLAVVVVQAGSEIIQRSVLEDAELSDGRDGTLRMQVPAGDAATGIVLDLVGGRPDAVAVIELEATIGEPNVQPINPYSGTFNEDGSTSSYVSCVGEDCPDQGGSGRGQPTGAAVSLRLTAMTGDIRPFRPYRAYSGQWLDFDSAPSLSPRLVVNRAAAKGLDRYRIPAQLHITGARADATPRIVGAVDDPGYQSTGYVRLDELLNWVPEATISQSGQGVTVLLAPNARDLAQTLRARLIANGTASDQISIETVTARQDSLRELRIVRWIFLGMAGLVLLIGVAGVLNVGLATVGERVEEFALRRAVGTSRLLLAGIVLTETLLTGLFTAAAAIGFSALGLRLVAVVFGSSEPVLANATFPWQAAVAGVTAGLIAGVLGGLIPALRAARIPIATVMRA